jgi:GNAT superfamily N-acetyltransferase
MSASREGIQIRPATIVDSEALAEVYLSSARHHASLDPEYYHVPDPEAVIRHMRDALSADSPSPVRTVRLLAEVGGLVLGSAEVTLQSPNPASMIRPTVAASVGVAVLEDQRGGGVGSRLMEAAEDWARERGATIMLLDASAANRDALRFYEERHGYRLRGVLMTKELEQKGPQR